MEHDARAFAQQITNTDTRIANNIGLLWQSYESTAGLILSAMLRLSSIPEKQSAPPTWQNHHWHDFLLNVLQQDTPIQNTRRFVAKDHQYLGQSLKAGEMILVVLAAANLDTSKKEALGFGYGSHRCPGQEWALQIAQTGISHLVAQGYYPQNTGLFQPSLNARIPLPNWKKGQ